MPYGLWEILTEGWGDAAVELTEVVSGTIRDVIEESDAYTAVRVAFGIGEQPAVPRR